MNQRNERSYYSVRIKHWKKTLIVYWDVRAVNNQWRSWR